MLFPYSTDAPVYHWPVATLGLIVANVVIFAGMVLGNIQSLDHWILSYGQGLHPEQWLSSLFIHAGFGHLFGNMTFLWVFGLVTEGKLGWWKFLCCYLGIGVTQSMIEQLVMLGYHGQAPGSVGASAAIFGLMALATVWAPLNEISFVWMFYIRANTIDISIAVLAACYTGFEILMLMLFGGSSGSSWLHLGGFALGFPLAVALLKRGVVDCEGWDLFHVWSGDYGAFKKEPDPAEVFAKAAARQLDRDQQQLADAKSQLCDYLRQGNADAALRLYRKMKDVAVGMTLDRDELFSIVKGLHAASRWADSAPLMAELIDRFPDGADPVRVKLAQICVVELNRPGKALDLLAEVDAARLPPAQVSLTKKIRAKAQQMQAEGVVEIDTDEW